MSSRNAYCSFCRKSYQEVGPLVEGPDEVYICGECVELCQSIIGQEKRRRSRWASGISALSTPEAIQGRLDQLVRGQGEATRALALVAQYHLEHPDQEQPGPSGRRASRRQVLLVGPTRSSKILLARALAHVLGVPFAHGEASDLVPGKSEVGELEPLLYKLLLASEFDVEAAQHGVVYVDGIDRPEAQDALLKLWDGMGSAGGRRLGLDVNTLLFICGGTFSRLDEVVAHLGRHPEQPITTEALLASGVLPRLAGLLPVSARVRPLDEKTLAHIVPWVDCGGVERAGAE